MLQLLGAIGGIVPVDLVLIGKLAVAALRCSIVMLAAVMGFIYLVTPPPAHRDSM